MFAKRRPLLRFVGFKYVVFVVRWAVLDRAARLGAGLGEAMHRRLLVHCWLLSVVGRFYDLNGIQISTALFIFLLNKKISFSKRVPPSADADSAASDFGPLRRN